MGCGVAADRIVGTPFGKCGCAGCGFDRLKIDSNREPAGVWEWGAVNGRSRGQGFEVAAWPLFG